MFDKNIPNNNLPFLPWIFDYNKVDFLKLAIKATWKLEKLNWLIYLIPNKEILISPLLIKESVESSAIENIHTTTIKVLQSKAMGWKHISWPEKEVLHYQDAILKWFELVKKYNWIWYNFFLEIQKIIEPNKPWIRTLPWTIIADGNWNAVYTPPEWKENIEKLLLNLEKFLNNFDDDIDPLIKMPVIHYQFESIHPFYDGNGRTWRVINILYLILAKKLDFPILFLSEYINKNKSKYYDLLNKTHQTWEYSDIIVYLLEWVIQQADKTWKKILEIKELMEKTEKNIEKLNMDYSKITRLLFSNVFLDTKTIEKKLDVSNRTVLRYIQKLEENKIVESVKIGKNKLIFIPEFVEILS